MKILLLILSLTISEPSEMEITEEFHSLNNEKSELEFIEKYSGNINSYILGYVTALEMKQAEYTMNPFTKLRIFTDSKNKLNQLIAENKSDVHLRYLRLMLQEKTPSFLGYNDHIMEDKEFLSDKLLVVDHSDFLDDHIRKNTSL